MLAFFHWAKSFVAASLYAFELGVVEDGRLQVGDGES
jgi:hypothetical protein